MAERQSIWLRIAEVIAGIILLILAIDVIFNPTLAINLLRLVLGIALIIMGLALIVRGAAARLAGMAGRVVAIILGIIVLILGVAVLVYTSFGQDLVLILFAIGILLFVISRIAFAGFARGVGAPVWVSSTSIVLGIIALIILIISIVFPSLIVGLLTLLVAIILFLLAIGLIVSGAAG